MPETRSSSIPPPPSSSGAPYIAGAVVLLLAIGGLAWYKFSGSNTQAVLPPVMTTAVPSVTAALPAIDIPMPAAMDASPGASTESPDKKVASGANLCAGPCDGNAPPGLRKDLSSAGAAARGCYERALRTSPMLRGKITVAVRVNQAGRVCDANIAQDTVGSAQVSSCVRGLFMAKKVTGASGGRCVDVQVPLSFEPRETK